MMNSNAAEISNRYIVSVNLPLTRSGLKAIAPKLNGEDAAMTRISCG
jgi:hypothetical protein